jgi:polyisoprenoid-binding protein YceI
MTALEALLSDPGTTGVWNIVPDRSAINFKIKNMWGLLTVKGSFTEFNGDGQLTGAGAVFGRIDIRAASVNTGIGRRDEHLRSADFFDVQRFPEISAVVTAVELAEHNAKTGAADLRANFTIKGVTEPLPLPVTINCLDDGAIRISGETKVDRAQFDLGWNRLGMMGATATVAAEAVFVRAPR